MLRFATVALGVGVRTMHYMRMILVAVLMLGGCVDEIDPPDPMDPVSEPLQRCSAVCVGVPVYCQTIVKNTPPTCSCPAPGGLTPLTCDNS